MILIKQNKLRIFFITTFGILSFLQSAEAGTFKIPHTIQSYFEDRFSELQVKECSNTPNMQGHWPMKRVFIKLKPQVGIGIDRILSLTAIPEISLGWEAVDHEDLHE